MQFLISTKYTCFIVTIIRMTCGKSHMLLHYSLPTTKPLIGIGIAVCSIFVQSLHMLNKTDP